MLLNGVVKQRNDEYDVNIVHISEVVSMYMLCQLMIINCNDSAVLKIITDMYKVVSKLWGTVSK
jgi:hypothetical protein